jgi:hypothetical protein
MLFGAREHLACCWLDPAGDRLRLDRLSRNAAGSTFFPWAEAHSSRSKKVSPATSSAALRPASGCVVDRLRPVDRHRGRGGRGLETAKEK